MDMSLLTCQMKALQVRYPGLALVQRRPGYLAVRGEIWFVMEHKARAIEDRFNIELRIPEDYPKTPPNAYETGGRLNGYHHLFTDGRLCLGAPVEVCKQFAMQSTLLSFVEELVVPFLFSFSYERQYGEMPFGELAHGGEGLLDYYVDFFRTSKEKTISLLIYLAVDDRNRHGSCPCGSGRRLERCHGPRLDTLGTYLTTHAINDELRELVSASRMIRGHRRMVLPRRLRRRLEKQLK